MAATAVTGEAGETGAADLWLHWCWGSGGSGPSVRCRQAPCAPCTSLPGTLRCNRSCKVAAAWRRNTSAKPHLALGLKLQVCLCFSSSGVLQVLGQSRLARPLDGGHVGAQAPSSGVSRTFKRHLRGRKSRRQHVSAFGCALLVPRDGTLMAGPCRRWLRANRAKLHYYHQGWALPVRWPTSDCGAQQAVCT